MQPPHTMHNIQMQTQLTVLYEIRYLVLSNI